MWLNELRILEQFRWIASSVGDNPIPVHDQKLQESLLCRQFLPDLASTDLPRSCKTASESACLISPQTRDSNMWLNGR